MQKMRAHMGDLSDLYVFAWTQPRTKREKKREKHKREKKKHYPSHRPPWIRKIARYIDHILRKKEEKEARRKRMILHTLLTRLRSEREEGCIVCANAYTGCADVNTRSDLRAINHDRVNHIYSSMDNWYYYLALRNIFLSSVSMRKTILFEERDIYLSSLIYTPFYLIRINDRNYFICT